MASVVIAAVLGVLAIRVLAIPQVQLALGSLAGMASGMAAARGYAVLVVALVVLVLAGVAGLLVLLHRAVVPGHFRVAPGGAS